MIARNEIDQAPLRPLEIALHSEIDGPAWLDHPCTLVVWLSGVRTEMVYKHGSTAHAAARRIANAHRLVKMPQRTRWRSRPK